MRLPDPIANTTTEAYLAYKAGVLAEGDLKPKLYEPYIHLDAWLAYWAGLVATYPTDKNGDPEMLTDEEAYIAYLSGVTDTYPEEFRDPADIRVAAYLRYLISARFGRPEYPVTNEELYLSMLKTQYIPSGDPSSDITIDGTAKAAFVDVKMYGDTFQQSYTGKNMIGFPARSYEQHGLTFDFDTDGTITINGTRSGTGATNYNPSVLFNFSAGDITYTVIPISGSFSGVNVGYRAVAGNAQAWYQVISSGGNYNQGTINKTAEQVAEITRIELLIGGGTAVFDNFKFKLQVTAGSDHDTNFEPFVGGQPSPSPEYPQPIQTVTGEQTVSINGVNYLIDLGSIELCKLGDYQDYIWKDGEDWKVHKAIAKYAFETASGTGANWEASTHRVYFTAIYQNAHGITFAEYKDTTTQAPLLADKFKALSFGDLYANGKSGIALSSTKTLSIRNNSWTDETTARNEIVGTTMYYALATATDTVITDQTLIAQLETLVAGGAEEGTTYIKVSATDPNLPALLYVEAPKYE